MSKCRQKNDTRFFPPGPQNDCEWFVYLRHFLKGMLEQVQSGRAVNQEAIAFTLFEMKTYDRKCPHVE